MDQGKSASQLFFKPSRRSSMHYRRNEENWDAWISRGCECFFRSRLSGWNCVRNLNRYKDVIQRHFIEIQMHEHFCKRQRWLLGCVNDGRAFVIAPVTGVETACTGEVVGVVASCQPVDNQRNMPWSIRTSSSSTAAGSCVRICRGLWLLKTRLGLLSQELARAREPKVSTACARTCAYSIVWRSTGSDSGGFGDALGSSGAPSTSAASSTCWSWSSRYFPNPKRIGLGSASGDRTNSAPFLSFTLEPVPGLRSSTRFMDVYQLASL